MQASLLYQYEATLGEGPLWDPRRNLLYWVDILGSTLHQYDPQQNTNEIFTLDGHIGCVGLTENPDELILAMQTRFVRFDVTTQTLTTLQTLPDKADMPMRFNDGAVTPAGTFWAGTLAYDFTHQAGTLYAIDAQNTVSERIHNLTISNGIAWSPDERTVYHVDSIPGTVTAYDYDAASDSIHNPRIIVDVPDGMGAPDGMAADVEGNLWIAHHGYSKVVCWSAQTGEPLREIDVPATQVTSCVFGGSDLRTLYISSARENLSEEQLTKTPLAGSVFSVEMPVAGLPPYYFSS